MILFQDVIKREAGKPNSDSLCHSFFNVFRESKSHSISSTFLLAGNPDSCYHISQVFWWRSRRTWQSWEVTECLDSVQAQLTFQAIYAEWERVIKPVAGYTAWSGGLVSTCLLKQLQLRCFSRTFFFHNKFLLHLKQRGCNMMWWVAALTVTNTFFVCFVQASVCF